MEIKIKYAEEGITPIEKISKGDWIDLRAAEDVFIPEGEFAMISLGVAMELPEGYEAQIAPRSSTFKNYGIIMTNSLGVIDNSYSGDNDVWHFPAYCLEARHVRNGVGRDVRYRVIHGSEINKNERICQFRIVERQPEIEFIEVESLGNPDRGGFGSTGVK